mgnify:CR=1 FL=1
MKKHLILWITFLLASTSFAANTLPVPKNLIALNTKEGKNLLEKSQYKQSFMSLMLFFTTEKGLANCATASLVMSLNALNVTAPITPEHAPYKIFNQNNLFTPSVLKIIIPAMIGHRGMTLDQATQALNTFNSLGVKAKEYHGSKIDENQFVKIIKNAISHKKIAVVNFCRKYINEKGCGHFSPIGAYNAKNDMFLVLDVARYKYPPVWVPAKELYKSVSTGIDSSSKKSRGLIIISNTQNNYNLD